MDGYCRYSWSRSDNYNETRMNMTVVAPSPSEAKIWHRVREAQARKMELTNNKYGEGMNLRMLTNKAYFQHDKN